MTQIYMPYPDFVKTAECLDNKRLNKQITEAKQVFTANLYGYGKQGNPYPYMMWLGYENALAVYVLALYKEWQNRLIDNRRGGKLTHKAGEFILEKFDNKNGVIMPKWINDERIFSSYRSALLAKDMDWYGQFGWKENPEIKYFYGV